MSVNVELFGIVRQRAGIEQTTGNGATLGEVLQNLAQRFPGLAECIEGRNLKSAYGVSLRGGQFVTNPDIELQPGDTLLLLSLDAGG